MSEIGKLWVSIGAKTDEFQKNMDSTQQKFQAMGAKFTQTGAMMTKNVTLPLLALGAGILALGVKAGNFADELLDLSAATGLTTDNLQQFRHAEVAAGVQTDSIADSITRMNRQMLEGGEFAARLTETANNYGVALRDANGQVRHASEVHHDLMMALSDIEDPQERARAGAQAFGRDWEKIAPVVALGREELEKVYQQEVISQEQLEKANEFRRSWDELKHSFSMAFMELGANLAPALQNLAEIAKDTLLPILKGLLGFIGKLAEGFAAMPKPIQGLIIGLVGLLIAAGPLLMLLGKIMFMLPHIISGIKLLSVVKMGALVPAFIASATAAWAFTAALLANPITWIVIAIVALIAILVLLIKNWDMVVDVFRMGWDAIKNAGIAVWDWFKDLPKQFLQWGKDIINKIWEGIKSAWEKLKKGIADIGQAIKDFFNPFKKSSPSLIELVQSGTHKIMEAYQGIEAPRMNVQQAAVAGVSAGGGTTNNYFSLKDIHVRDDRDIEKIALELYSLQTRRDRGV